MADHVFWKFLSLSLIFTLEYLGVPGSTWEYFCYSVFFSVEYLGVVVVVDPFYSKRFHELLDILPVSATINKSMYRGFKVSYSQVIRLQLSSSFLSRIGITRKASK